MKTPEDEAFDDLSRNQGAWGGGFQAKRQMAADKLQGDLINYGTSWEKDGERIDPMSVYKEPAAMDDRQRLEAIVSVINKYLPPLGMHIMDAMSAIISLVDPLPAPQPAQEPFGWYSAQEDEFMTHKIRKEHERLNSYTHVNGKFDLPLYTAPPPKREWVDLAEEEIHNLDPASDIMFDQQRIDFARAVEAATKDKNNGT
jgi:hypothetical protein